ncbi:MAG: hypothetical protein IJL92_10190 [Thermoguttaceae bacterium]|nr:hypothetical protein [Thermoguttaceae bacterium]
MGKLCKGFGSGVVNFVIIAGPVVVVTGTALWILAAFNQVPDDEINAIATVFFPIIWGFWLLSLVLMLISAIRYALPQNGRVGGKALDPLDVQIPNLDGRRTEVVFLIATSAIFSPIILVLGFLTLFTLAFIDYVPPDTTLSDWFFAPIGVVSFAFLASLSLPAYALFRIIGSFARCSWLDGVMLRRMNAVREKCEAFYEQHGRAPGAEDQIELNDEANDVSFVVLTGEEELAALGGKQAIVASTAPWQSAFGWHGVVLWEDGQIEVIKKYSYVLKFYRAVDRILAIRRTARKKNA